MNDSPTYEELDYWVGRARHAEEDADRLYNFVLVGGDRQAVLVAHIHDRQQRGDGSR